jgi:DNA-binding NtrC family response regulator
MIVDDEIALVRLAEELLAGLGYEPIGFESSADALRAFETDPDRFDAVLSDEAMPGLRGSEMAGRMLAIRPGLPFLLMSGNLGDEAERAAQASGIAGVLHKPLALRQIAEALAGLLGT